MVKEPTNPVPTAGAIIGEIESLLNKVVVNHAKRKLPIKLMVNVPYGNELLVNKETPIKYLKIAPIDPAMPTQK